MSDRLRPGGHVAFSVATHVFPAGGDPLVAEIQDVYSDFDTSKPGADSQPRPGQLPNLSAEILASGLFGAGAPSVR